MPNIAHVELFGDETVVKVLALAGERTPAVLTQALLEEANIAFRRSQVQVPFRTGVLKGSGRVGVPVVSGTEVFVDITYGGAAEAYAYIMHRGTMHGKPINYRNGKKDHYLSDPVAELLPGFESRLLARLETMLI